MADDLPPPDPLTSTIPPPPTTTTTTISPPPDPPPQLDNPPTTAPPKRQRRPSVRLGEIGGDPTYDPHSRRPNRTTWRATFHKHPSSKTRPLTNLVNGVSESNFQEPENFAHRKPKFRKPTKRARTNWTKFELPVVNIGGGEGALREENGDNDDNFRVVEPDPEPENSESPVNSVENMGLQYWDKQSRGNELQHNEGNSVDEKRSEESIVGVRDWLSGLGLGRYAPVFEIHEVDDEVLPLLTLEDLKDMGINAVGSRRKMYSAILKLRKGLS